MVLVEAVLETVERIPVGRVLSYGDVADEVGLRSARPVGLVLHRHGAAVPWHRVVMADGRLAAGKGVEQLRRLRAEGTPLVADGSRVDMRRARWRR